MFDVLFLDYDETVVYKDPNTHNWISDESYLYDRVEDCIDGEFNPYIKYMVDELRKENPELVVCLVSGCFSSSEGIKKCQIASEYLGTEVLNLCTGDFMGKLEEAKADFIETYLIRHHIDAKKALFVDDRVVSLYKARDIVGCRVATPVKVMLDILKEKGVVL